MVLFNKLLLKVVWSFLVILSLYFFFDNVIAYFYGYRSPVFGNSLFHNQVWVAAHMAGGSLTLFLGPVQFIRWIRIRFVNLHRILGKLYMAGVALAGLSALRLSLISSCIPCRISLFLLSVFALLSTALAWKAIRQRNIKAHRQFMVRSYICIMAFVAVRIDNIISLDFLFGTIENALTRRIVNEYFWSFVPLIIAEIIMVWLPSVKKGKERQKTAV